MELRLDRYDKQSQRTLGKLYVDGLLTCLTLEDTVRAPGVKIAGQTAIPYGRYRVTMTFSPKFLVLLPLVNDVPGFDGIRIHPGNTEENTEGCILVGQKTDGTSISGTSFAYGEIIMFIYHAWMSNQEIWLTIQDQ